MSVVVEEKNQVFSYVRLIDYLKTYSGKSQRELSGNAGCTEMHLSNVAKGKARLSLKKLLGIMNEGNICMDDFVVHHYRTVLNIHYEDRKLFKGLTDEEVILFVDFLKELIALKRGRKKTVTENKWERKSIEKFAGRMIKKLRIQKGIPLEKMAQQIGMETKSYQNIESGRSTVYENYIVIAKTLGVPASVLFSDFLQNKKSIANYKVCSLFETVNQKEREILRSVITEMAVVLRNISENF